MRGASRGPESGASSAAEGSARLVEIQEELEALARRRAALEEQRRKLLSGRGDGAGDSAGCRHAQARRTGSAPLVDQSVTNHSSRIPSEAERLGALKKSVFREMKESMRRSWEHDSSLVMGSFLLEDNPRASTFGRERRFIPIMDQKGPYYLGTDLELMQKHKNQLITSVTASRRGERGMNISSHWNDLKCVGSPGPGAYTPHYNKVSKPSILTRR